MMDVENTFDASSILTAFQQGLDFDVICSNGLNHLLAHYDVLAYRDLDRENLSIYWHSGKFERYRVTQPLFFRGLDLIPAASCFSGLAMYPMKMLHKTGCQYSKFQNGELDVEHAELHLYCLAPRNHSKVYISPSTINWWESTNYYQTPDCRMIK